MKILAVDDDESILELIDHSLTISAHHDVTTAASATQALEKIEHEADGFDCFLVDIQMPRIDGIELTRLIRRTAGYTRKPIVMLTAMHEKRYLDMAFKAGATDYITKPFHFRDLRSRIFEAGKLGIGINQDSLEDSTGVSVSWLRGELIHDGPLPLEDGGKLQSFLPYAAFENYAQEIARAYMRDRMMKGNSGPAAMGLKLTCLQSARKDSPKEQVGAILADVVRATSAVFKDGLSSVSYSGNGSFMCLMAKHLNESSGSIERELNVYLQSCLNGAADSGLQLFVGNQVPVRTASPSAVLDILWMANESVEQKFIAARNHSKLKNAS